MDLAASSFSLQFLGVRFPHAPSVVSPSPVLTGSFFEPSWTTEVVDLPKERPFQSHFRSFPQETEELLTKVRFRKLGTEGVSAFHTPQKASPKKQEAEIPRNFLLGCCNGTRLFFPRQGEELPAKTSCPDGFSQSVCYCSLPREILSPHQKKTPTTLEGIEISSTAEGSQTAEYKGRFGNKTLKNTKDEEDPYIDVETLESETEDMDATPEVNNSLTCHVQVTRVDLSSDSTEADTTMPALGVDNLKNPAEGFCEQVDQGDSRTGKQARTVKQGENLFYLSQTRDTILS